jgi:Glycosyl hydrolases family 2, sugar binding domain
LLQDRFKFWGGWAILWSGCSPSLKHFVTFNRIIDVKKFLYIALSLSISISASAQVIKLRGEWKFRIGDKSMWANVKYDDTDWEEIRVPAAWEDEGFNGYDGFAWYRKKFDGHKLSKEETYYLNLGYIDDCDEVYVNGKLVGVSGSMPPKFKTAYQSERRYSLPSEVIDFDGENTIAVRVFDVIHGGGIIDGDLGIYRSPKSRMLADLSGLWQFAKTRNEKPLDASAEWSKVMVPSAWEHQGYYKYDGYAWYRKTFTLPANFSEKDEEIVLMLGKIDDFDKTYLNGKLIGQTNDGEDYGDSRSFERMRVYTIPNGLLKKDAVNVIEVLVEDMGNTGGIYEGPIGITTRTAYQRYFKNNSESFWKYE